MSEIYTNMLDFSCRCGCIGFYIVGDNEMYICQKCGTPYTPNGEVEKEYSEIEELKVALNRYRTELKKALEREEKFWREYSEMKTEYVRIKDRINAIKSYALDPWEMTCPVEDRMGR